MLSCLPSRLFKREYSALWVDRDVQNLVDALHLGFIAVYNDKVSVHFVSENAHADDVWSVFATLENYKLIGVVAVRINFFHKADFNLIGVSVHCRDHLRECEVAERTADSQCNLVDLMKSQFVKHEHIDV